MALNQFSKISPLVNNAGYLYKETADGALQLSTVKLKEKEVGICYGANYLITMYNNKAVHLNGGYFKTMQDLYNYIELNGFAAYGHNVYVQETDDIMFISSMGKVYSLSEDDYRTARISIGATSISDKSATVINSPDDSVTTILSKTLNNTVIGNSNFFLSRISVRTKGKVSVDIDTIEQIKLNIVCIPPVTDNETPQWIYYNNRFIDISDTEIFTRYENVNDEFYATAGDQAPGQSIYVELGTPLTTQDNSERNYRDANSILVPVGVEYVDIVNGAVSVNEYLFQTIVIPISYSADFAFGEFTLGGWTDYNDFYETYNFLEEMGCQFRFDLLIEYDSDYPRPSPNNVYLSSFDVEIFTEYLFDFKKIKSDFVWDNISDIIDINGMTVGSQYITDSKQIENIESPGSGILTIDTMVDNTEYYIKDVCTLTLKPPPGDGQYEVYLNVLFRDSYPAGSGIASCDIIFPTGYKLLKSLPVWKLGTLYEISIKNNIILAAEVMSS